MQKLYTGDTPVKNEWFNFNTFETNGLQNALSNEWVG